MDNIAVTFSTDQAAAIEKINAELQSFSGGNKEKAVSTYVANTLRQFSEEDERFARVVLNTKRTLSDCCEEIMQGVRESISDIEVYRRATKFYFPNSEVEFNMVIHLTGDAPTEEEMNQAPKPRPAPAPKTPKATKTGAKAKKKTPKETNSIQLSLF
jgi:hypothetical protein